MLIGAGYWKLRDGISPDTVWRAVPGTVETSSVKLGSPGSGSDVARITVAYSVDGAVRRISGNVYFDYRRDPSAYRKGTQVPVFVHRQSREHRASLDPPGTPELLWLTGAIFGTFCVLGAYFLRRR
jgi:hypothetical protein